MRFFVSGPYTADSPREVLINVNRAIEVGIQLMIRGHSVFIPHLSHYIHLHQSCPFTYEEYIKNDLEWLKVSEAIIIIDTSPGSDREAILATELGLQVYRLMMDVPYIA